MVAHLLEQADELRLLHVLDAVDPEQGRVAAVTLDFLGEPLELLVAVARVGKQIGPALQGNGPERAEPAPRAHAQARRARR